MPIVTVSRDFRIVIPLEVRKALRLTPGQKLITLPYQDRIELIPVHAMHKMRGLLNGIDTAVPRDVDEV